VRPTTRAPRAGDKPAPDSVLEKKQPPPSKTAPVSAASTIASTVLSAAAALAKKRKALNDNTNAEKKKLLKARAGKVKEAEKQKDVAAAVGTDSAATSVSGSTKLVVELPTRKRRASQAASRVEEVKQVAEEPVATLKPAIAPSKRKVAAAARQAKAIEPEPVSVPPNHEDEPEPKRRRSNDRIAIPKDKPEIVEAAQAVPSKVEDNPFDVGPQKTTEETETVGMGTTQRWDDLDAEDADDPTMVAEYVAEIFDYMKELEVRVPRFQTRSSTN
jgi:hypothetical protein